MDQTEKVIKKFKKKFIVTKKQKSLILFIFHGPTLFIFSPNRNPSTQD